MSDEELHETPAEETVAPEESVSPDTVEATDPAVEEQPQGSLSMQQANEQALTLMSGFIILVVAVLVGWTALSIGIHGPDAVLFNEDNSLHRIVSFPDALARLPHAPGTLFTLAANASIGGMNTTVLHLGNVLLHALNAILVFLICRNLFRKSIPDIGAAVPALLVAACPFVVESVGLLSGRFVLQGSFFGLLFVLSMLKQSSKEEAPFLAFGPLVFYACAFASWYGMIFLPVVGLLASLLRGGVQGASRLATIHASVFALGGVLIAAVWAAGWTMDGVPQTQLYEILGYEPLLYLASIFLLPIVPHLLRPVATGPMPMVAGVATGLAVIVGGYWTSQDYLFMQTPVQYWESKVELEETPAYQYAYVLDAVESSATYNEQGRMDQASINLLNQYATGATIKHPDVADFHLTLGQSQFLQQDFAGAATSLNQAIALDPFSQQGVLMLAQAKEQQMNQSGGDRALMQDVVELYAAAEAMGPIAPVLQQRNAMMRLGLGDIQGAYQRLARLQDPNADDNPTLKQLAAVLQRAATLENEMTELLMKNTKDASAFAKQAESSFVQGKTIQAFYQLDRQMQREAPPVELWRMLGTVYAQLELAEAFVTAWGEHEHASDDNWKTLGQQVAMAGVWDSARVYLEQVVPEEGQVNMPLVILAQMALSPQIQQVPRALQYLTEATAAYPDRYEPWLLRADLAILMKQSVEAEKLIQEAQQRGAPAEQVKLLQDRMKETGQSIGEPTRTIIR